MSTSILSNLAKLSQQVGIFQKPLLRSGSKIHQDLCLERNILRITQTSEKVATSAEFPCQKMPHIPVLDFAANPLLSYKIKTGKCVAINPGESTSDLRYIPSSLNAAIKTLETTSPIEQSEAEKVSLYEKIQNIYNHFQSIETKTSNSLVCNGSNESLVLKRGNDWLVFPVRAERFLQEKDFEKQFEHHQGNFYFLDSIYDVGNNTSFNSLFPCTLFTSKDSK